MKIERNKFDWSQYLRRSGILASLILTLNSWGQVLFSDNFESGGSNWTLNVGGFGDNPWVINNDYSGFIFTTTPSQPAPITNAPNSFYLHITNQTFCNAGFDCQAVFDAGSTSDYSAVMTNNISTVGFTGVTLEFYYLCAGMSGFTYGNVEYSINNGVSWLPASPNYAGVNTWTLASLTNPAWDNQAQLKFRFRWRNDLLGNDPAFSVDEVQIYVPTTGNSITTDNVSILSWCQGTAQNLNVDFTANGTYNAGNVFTAELSDATGSFAAPVSIGTLASTSSGSQTIACTVPGATPAGNGYRIRVVSSNPATTGTDNGTNIVINTTPAAPLIGTITQPNCTNSQGSVILNGLPGSGTWQVTGTPGGISQSGTGSSTTISGLNPSTTYTFTVSLGSCTSPSSTNVVINAIPGAPAAPTAAVTVQPDCNTPTGTISITAPTGANYTYSVGGAYQSSTSFTGLAPNTYNVTVQDNSSGCTSSATVLTINPPAGAPTISLSSSSDVSCFGGNDGELSVGITGGTGPYSYTWSPSGGNSATASGLSAGSYTITVTDASNCQAQETYAVAQPSQIIVSGNITDATCTAANGAVTASATGGNGSFTYSWSNGAIGATAPNLSAGSYTVTAIDGTGCSATQQFTVASVGNITINVTPASATILLGESVQLSASGATNYTWSPGIGLSCTDCSDPVATPSATTNYTVIGTDANGCTATANVLITIELDCGEIFVPTAFSPNEDNTNDMHCVYGGCFENFSYSVYNRWGELLYSTDDPTKCWDGKYKGEYVQTGTYVYKIESKLLDGTYFDQSGNIQLTR